MIYLGADHDGWELKEKVKGWLSAWGREFEDLGNDRQEPEDDFPDFAVRVAKKLSRKGNAGDLGVLICSSGVGMDIVANRFSSVRCGLGFSPQQIRLSRRDDDINCLALPADYLDEPTAKTIVQMFLETQFSQGEKYLRRIKKIEKLD